MDILSNQIKVVENVIGPMHELILPLIKRVEAFQKSFEPLVEMQAHVQKTIESMDLWKLDLPDFCLIANQMTDLQKLIQNSFGLALLEIQEGFKSFPVKVRKSLLVIGNHGWYYDLELSLPELIELASQLEAEGEDKVDDILSSHFEDRLSEIEKSISTKYPHRSHIIQSAFGAHRRGEYVLSIPALLAQTDGICKEVMGQNLFTTKDKKPCTALYVSQLAADSSMAALLSPLSEVLPISQNTSQRSGSFDALNRHMVLHGESLDYGTRINGLKAVSLVNYVAEILSLEALSSI